MELAYKEELFFTLSASMEREEAELETERVANNFKKLILQNHQLYNLL